MRFIRHSNKLSALTIAVGLACGGPALAGEQGSYEDRHDGAYNEPVDEQVRDENGTFSGGTEWSAEERDSMARDDDEMNDAAIDDRYERNDEFDTAARDDAVTHGDRAAVETSDSRYGENDDRFLSGTVVTDNDLNEFRDAAEKVGLTSSLDDDTQYTVFAPTDEAFEQFRQAHAQLSDQELRQVLKSHIVAGRIDSKTIRSLTSAEALTGDTIRINPSGGALEVGDARVVDEDIESGNLIVHTIDSVIADDAWEFDDDLAMDREEAE